MQRNDDTVTESKALGVLLKISETQIKRGKFDERKKHALLGALYDFGELFLPPEEYSPTRCCDDEKTTPYEMAYLIISATENLDLKALWYVFYPYLVAASPHIDETLYEKTKELLCTDEVFAAVLSSRYRLLVTDCYEDLQAAGLAGVYIEWYSAYSDYKKQVTKDGDTREIQTYKKLLASGDFSAVIDGTEQLLDRDPYDIEVALLNIAAKVSALSAGSAQRECELNDTVEFIDGYLNSAESDRHLTYLHYYRALCYLGLTACGQKTVQQVKDELGVCLSITPNFELAEFMLSAIEKKIS